MLLLREGDWVVEVLEAESWVLAVECVVVGVMVIEGVVCDVASLYPPM